MNSFYPVCLLLLTLGSTGLCRSRLHKRDAQDDAYWTDVVGSLLQDIAADIVEKEGKDFAVENFTSTFGGKLLDGKVSATGGSVGDLSTLRFVNLSVTSTADSLTVTVQLSLDSFWVSYSSFEASIRLLAVSGGFNATVANNLLTARATLLLSDDDCRAALDVLEVSRLEGIDLAVTGIEMVNDKLVSRFANMVVNKFTPELRAMAEVRLRELVEPYVALACEYFTLNDVDEF